MGLGIEVVWLEQVRDRCREAVGEEAVSCGLGEPSPTAWVPEGRAVAPQGIRPPAYIKAAALDFHERYQLPKALSALTYFVTQSRSL